MDLNEIKQRLVEGGHCTDDEVKDALKSTVKDGWRVYKAVGIKLRERTEEERGEDPASSKEAGDNRAIKVLMKRKGIARADIR